jgi:predicted enzyme related to lactoylglutathione lyase
MAQPVVHFEIIGEDPTSLRRYYGALFGWDFDTTGPVADAVSTPGQYGFTDPGQSTAGAGIPGGIGGGAGYQPRTLFYVGVSDVEDALAEAERLGGTRVSGPHRNSDSGGLVVGFFTDPDGHLVGLASAS